MLKKLSVILFALAISGCSGFKIIKEPDNFDKSLLLGSTTFSILNSDVAAIKDGDHHSTVVLEMRNSISDKLYKVESSNSDGFFYSFDLKPGKYSIKRVILKKTISYSDSEETHSLYIRPQEEMIFNIKSGEVNNIGELLVTMNMSDNYSKMYLSNHEKVKKFFIEENKGSQWLHRKWNSIEL